MKIKFKNKYQAKIGEIDNNGFMRIKLRVNSICVLKYYPDEFPEWVREHPELRDKKAYYELNDEASVFDADSIKSLEGIPILADRHEWVLPKNVNGNQSLYQDDVWENMEYTTPEKAQVGQIAGTPMREGNYLVANGLITDRNIIERIKNNDLIEISPAYEADVEVASGEWHGKHYDIIQKPAYYNHILLIGANQGRTGPDLKILNKKNKREDTMGDQKIGVSTPEGTVYVLPESQGILEKFVKSHQKNSETLVRQTDQLSDLEAEKAKNKKLMEENEALKSDNQKKQGEIDATKTELDRATSPEAVEEMVSDMKEADSVVEAIGDESLTAETQGLKMADKKKKIVKFYLSKQGRKVDDKTLDNSYVKGVWGVLTDSLLNEKKAQNNVPVGVIFKDSKPFAGNTKTRTKAQMLGFKK